MCTCEDDSRTLSWTDLTDRSVNKFLRYGRQPSHILAILHKLRKMKTLLVLLLKLHNCLELGLECNYENETIYCQNGKCHDDQFDWQAPGCDCGAGYVGPRCELSRCEADNPCNGGTCTLHSEYPYYLGKLLKVN